MAGSPIPILETRRLRLRSLRTGDFADSHAMWSSPEVVRHITGKPSTREETWARLLRNVGHWTLFHFGVWAVETRATSSFIGEVGLADYKREMQGAVPGAPEMGWVLVPQAHGSGYASEAVRAVAAWADANLDFARTSCIIAPANLASIGVAKKVGFRECAATTYRNEPTLVFERPRGGIPG